MKNPHDKIFKETFTDLSVTKDFLSHYLPKKVMQHVDLTSLASEKDSFIDDELKESFSDLLFSVNIHNKQGYLYFLFEHKSSPDKGIVLQLLGYLVDIWKTKVKKHDEWELPVVIPLVIYQGSDKWNGPYRLSEMILGYDNIPEEVKIYIPDFTYQFHDLSHRSDEEIKGQAILKIYHTLVRELSNPNNKNVLQSILKALTYLAEIENKQRGIEYFETVMRYIFGAGKDLTEDQVQEIIDQVSQIYPEGSDVVMTLAEHYRDKGKEEGLTEGLTEGVRLGTVKSISQLLTQRFGDIPEDIHQELNDLDLASLENILKNILELEEIEDVRKYIH